MNRDYVGFDVHATFVLALALRKVCLDRSVTLQNFSVDGFVLCFGPGSSFNAGSTVVE